MASGGKRRRSRELEKEVAYLQSRLDKLLAQQARQERVAETHHTLLKRVNQEYQELLDELSAANAQLEREVGERKAAQEWFRQASEQLTGILEHSSFPILVMDTSFCYLYFNPRTIDLMGVDPDGYVGTTATDYFPEHEARAFQAVDAEVFRHRRSITREETLTVAGRRCVMIITKFPLTNAEGEIWGLCAVAQDITEQKELEMEALRAAQLASLGELAAGVAHEINNPVNGIINYAQLIADAEPGLRDEICQEYARRIVAEGGRVADIVKRLLGFARSPGRAKKPVDLAGVLEDALGLTEAGLRHGGVVLVRNLPGTLPPVLGDHQELQQVFLSLIANARQAMEGQDRDGKTLEITAWQVAHDGAPAVRIAFRDSGPGLCEEAREHAFEPFYTSKDRGQGTGLGLSIAHRIVREHKGAIQIFSEPGEYAEFVLTLPVA